MNTNDNVNITPEGIAKALQAQVNEGRERVELLERATRVESLDREIKRLTEEKAKEAALVLPLIHKYGAGGQVVLTNGAVVAACVAQDKRPSKKGIVAFFGEKGEEYWKSIPGKIREYLSVKRPGGTASEGEEQ